MPCAWQGWLVYAVAFGLLLAGPFLFSPFREPIAFQLYTWAVVLVLVLICWMKGAPPRLAVGGVERLQKLFSDLFDFDPPGKAWMHCPMWESDSIASRPRLRPL
ncbi:unnamed protein product [Stenotrophomonas maltophilia]|nr:unnamed protein product [Stenotrophomonas maltophilia]